MQEYEQREGQSHDRKFRTHGGDRYDGGRTWVFGSFGVEPLGRGGGGGEVSMSRGMLHCETGSGGEPARR